MQIFSYSFQHNDTDLDIMKCYPRVTLTISIVTIREGCTNDDMAHLPIPALHSDIVIGDNIFETFLTSVYQSSPGCNIFAI